MLEHTIAHARIEQNTDRGLDDVEMGYRKWEDSVTSNWRKEFGVRIEYGNDCIDIARVQKIPSVLICLRVSSLGENRLQWTIQLTMLHTEIGSYS